MQLRENASLFRPGVSVCPDGAEHHVLAEVVLCAVGRVAPLPADGDDGAKHCLARAGDEPPAIYNPSSVRTCT